MSENQSYKKLNINRGLFGYPSSDDLFLTDLHETEIRVPAETLASFFKISTRKIRGLAQSGVIPKADKNQYLLKESINGYTEHLRHVAARWTASPDEAAPGSVESERARLTRAKADEQERKNQVACGQLVKSISVENEWSGILRGVRDAILAVPERIRSRHTELSNPQIETIDLEIRQALEDIADV